MLHWKTKVTYLSVTALTIPSAFVGEFDALALVRPRP